LAFGLALAAVVAAVGHVSGAHVNPAVTLGMAATGKFPWQYTPHYVGAQLVGAVLAAFATWVTFGGAGARGEAKLAATYPAQGVGDLQAFVVEILITFILVFVVMAVATDQRAPAAIAPIAVGFSLAVGVFIAGPVTGGSVNPARSLGPMIVAGTSVACGFISLGRSSEGGWLRCSTTAPWPRPKAQASDFTGQHESRLRERLDVLGGGTEDEGPENEGTKKEGWSK
jgi:MIP family channel proteins